MNAANDPWIPVTDSIGQPGVVSLRQVFTEGASLQDLAVRPHERVALMRLLICVAQAALDGPADSDAWEDLEEDQTPLVAAASRYLDRWQDRFNLFDPERPFLQFPGLTKPPKAPKPSKTVKISNKPPLEEAEEEANAASKLDFALATGSNPTLFDEASGRFQRTARIRRSETRHDASYISMLLAGWTDWEGALARRRKAWRGRQSPCSLHALGDAARVHSARQSIGNNPRQFAHSHNHQAMLRQRLGLPSVGAYAKIFPRHPGTC